MLKGIDPIVGPELLYTLARMGHGDWIAIVDPNYPAYSGDRPVHRLDGVDAVRATRAVLSLMPLDSFIRSPMLAMSVVGDPEADIEIHREVLSVANESSVIDVRMTRIDREAFYAQARAASAVLVTGETRPYGCFLFAKGVWPHLTPGSATTEQTDD